MQKLVKRISLVMVALMTVFTALSYVPAKAATVVPKVQFVGKQQTEFTAGERVTFNLNAANYGGRVQYRVVLWNDSTKSYSDLWNTADKYYTNWMPYGNETLPLGWVINEPGTYRITIYAKRAGLANSKTALKGMNCDSYLNGPAFVVKPAAAPAVESIAPVADVTVNEGETPVLPTEVTLNLADKTTKTAKVTWDKVDTTKVGTVAVAGTVEGTDKKASVNVIVKAVDFKVESVNAINLREVEVKFNKAVDSLDRTNFAFNAVTVSANKYVNLSEDKKSAIVTVERTIRQNDKIKVTVSNVKSGSQTINEYNQDVVFIDREIPKVEKVEAIGNKLIRITFSEPVQDIASAKNPSNYKIDGKMFTADKAITVNEREIEISLYNRLSAGEKTLVIDPNAVKDYAEYAIGPNEAKFTVIADSNKPTATVVSSTQQEVVVKFDKELVAAPKIYWMDGSTKRISEVGVLDSVDYTKYTFAFSDTNRLPLKETEVIVDVAKDYFGNEAKDSIKLLVNATADLEKPTLVSAVGRDQVTIRVTFSKPVAPTSANFKVMDNKGVLKSATTVTAVVNTNNKTWDITFPTMDASRNPYVLLVKGVVDRTVYKNTMIDTEKEVTIVDKSTPSVTDVYRNVEADQRKLSVVFNKPIDFNSVSTANFAYRLTGQTLVFAMPAGTYIDFSGDRTVIITLPDKWDASSLKNQTINDISALQIQGVKDLSGNQMFAEEKLSGSFTPVTSTGTVGINKLFVIDSKTIIFEPKQTFSSVYAGDFEVVSTDGKQSVDVIDATITTSDDVNEYSDYGITSGKPVVELTLGTALQSDGTYKVDNVKYNMIVRTKSVVDYTYTSLGNKANFTCAISATNDKIAPVKPVDTLFAFTNASNKIATKAEFIADESVSLQYALVIKDATLPTAGTAMGAAFAGKTYFASGLNDTLVINRATDLGKYIWIRAVDANGNESEWVKIAEIVPVAPGATYNLAAKTLSGVTDKMEYSVDGGSYTAIAKDATTVTNLVATRSIEIREAATSTCSAGDVQTINIGTAPEAPRGITLAKGTNYGTTKLTGTANGQEYSINGGTYVSITDVAVDNIPVNVGDKIVVREAATASNPAGIPTAEMVVATADINSTLTKISTAAIAGVTVPVKGATPVATIAETTEYTATISWAPADATFGASTVYTATITITPKAGYTLTGITVDFFTVTGATATNAADSGVITAVFPATGA